MRTTGTSSGSTTPRALAYYPEASEGLLCASLGDPGERLPHLAKVSASNSTLFRAQGPAAEK